MAKRGRKPQSTKWVTDKGLKQIEDWRAENLSHEEISTNMGISTVTFYDWIKKFPNITYSLKKGEDRLVNQVKNKFYERAMGYTYNETKTKEEYGVITEVITTVKHMPADVGAGCFILKNKAPDEYKDRRENEVSIEGFKMEVITSTRELPQSEYIGFEENIKEEADDKES